MKSQTQNTILRSETHSSLKPIPLTVRLFGSLEMEQGGIPLPRTRTVKEMWLLALLVLRHQKTVDRTWLGGILWPDSDQVQASRNLRRSLNNLRHTLGENAFRLFAPTPLTLSFDLSGVHCDLVEFDRLIASGDTTAQERAIGLYRGPLLADCPEGWAEVERVERERAYLRALERLATHLTDQGEQEKALHYLRLALRTDPFRETAQQSLMQILAQSGDIIGATLAYRQFRLRLHEELQSSPAPETVALYQQIRKGERTPPRPSESPAPVSPSSSLPRPLSRLIGRTEEIAAILEQFETARLVTLTGSGGVGKTRLAIATAERMTPTLPSGVWFVELAPITDPAQLERAVAKALGIRTDSSRPIVEALTDFLREKHALLILDNCEHLIEASVALVKALSSSCPNLLLLATSRQTLGLRGERNWRVPSLSIPAETTDHDLETVLQYDAVRLFLDRAQEIAPHFVLTDANADDVGQICHQLDGIPLAIELAAARVRALSPREIRQRLADRFRLLTTGDRSVLPRHQTLRALIDWSYDLLTEAEKVLLYRLTVFVGGWTLKAAESVCGDAPFESEDILDLLTSLVDKSLVVAVEQQGEMRFSLLETVRQYASEKRLASGEDIVLRTRHRDWFLALAEEGAPHFRSTEQLFWLDRINNDHDNMRAALAWCAEQPAEAEAGLRLAGALAGFWRGRDYATEGRSHLQQALTHDGALAPTLARGVALNGAGQLALDQGDFPMARVLYEESLAIFQQLNHRPGIATSLYNLGGAFYNLGNFEQARTFHTESLAIRRELGDTAGVGSALHGLGIVAYGQGDYALAQPLFQESLELFRDAGDRHGMGHSLFALGNIAYLLGDYPKAQALLEEALGLWRYLGNQNWTATTLVSLGIITQRRNAYDKARDLFEKCLAIFERLGERNGIADALDRLGYIAFMQGDYVRARTLHEASHSRFKVLGKRLRIAGTMINLGYVTWGEGDYAKARALFIESLIIVREMGNKHSIAETLNGLAMVALAMDDAHKAVRLWGATEALRESLHSPIAPNEKSAYDYQVSLARAALSPDAFAAGWAEGRALPLETAIEYALTSEPSSSH